MENLEHVSKMVVVVAVVVGNIAAEGIVDIVVAVVVVDTGVDEEGMRKVVVEEAKKEVVCLKGMIPEQYQLDQRVA